MSLCDRVESPRHAWPPAPDLSPAERDAAQELILARWLALVPSYKNDKLTRERVRQGVAEPAAPTHPVSARSCAKRYTYRDHTRTIPEWAAVTGIPAPTLYARLAKQWPLERCLYPHHFASEREIA